MKTIVKYVLVMWLPTAIFECSYAEDGGEGGETLVEAEGTNHQAYVDALCKEVKCGDTSEREQALQNLGEMDSIESLEALKELRDYYWTKHAGVIRELVKRGDIEAHDYLILQINSEGIKDKQRVWAAMLLMTLSSSHGKYRIIEDALSNDMNSDYLRGGLREALFKSVWDESSALAAEILIKNAKSEHEIRNAEDFIKRSKHITFTPEDKDMLLDMIAERRLELKEMRANSISNQVPLKASETEN